MMRKSKKTVIDKKPYIINTALFAISFLFLLSATGFLLYQSGEWIVPQVEQERENPIPLNPASQQIGASLYATHCKSCHGEEGLGNGEMASELSTICGDFSSTAFQAQTDGALFYKITTGRGEMPPYKDILSSADDRWHLINYLRSLERP